MGEKSWWETRACQVSVNSKVRSVIAIRILSRTQFGHQIFSLREVGIFFDFFVAFLGLRVFEGCLLNVNLVRQSKSEELVGDIGM